MAPTETNGEHQRLRQTQWLDFGKPGTLKSLTGMDFDGKNITQHRDLRIRGR